MTTGYTTSTALNDQPPLQNGDKFLLNRLSVFIRPHLKLLFAAGVFLFLVMALDLSRPYILKLTIDNAIPNRSLSLIKEYSLLYLMTIIISFISLFMETYLLETFGQKIIFTIRQIIFKKILAKTTEDFNSYTVGNLVTRVTNDVEALRTLYTDVLLKLFSSLIMILGILVSMYLLNMYLAIVVTILIPLMFWLIFVYQKYARKAFRGIRSKLAASNTSVQEMLNFIVIIKSYVGEKIIANKYERVSQEYLEAGLFEVKTFAIFRPLVDGLYFVAIIAILGFTDIFDNVIEAGTVFAFLQYMNKFFQPLKDIAEKYNSLQSSLAGAERLIPILEEEEVNHIVEEVIPEELAKVNSVIFEHVYFKYPQSEDWVLEDINFSLKKGEFIGIVGPTGSGKSTLMSLLMGFYRPTAGRILINGNDVSEYSPRILRELIGYVFQDCHLFKGSIKENLTLYDTSISEDNINNVTEQAQLVGMIHRLPQGYDTPVGYLGSLLSSGEKQLLALARTLVKHKEILIFDEATANLDSQTEGLLQKSLENLRSNRTIISIAHRLSTIKEANQILLIKNGKLLESGNFSDLINKKGEFYKLWKE